VKSLLKNSRCLGVGRTKTIRDQIGQRVEAETQPGIVKVDKERKQDLSVVKGRAGRGKNSKRETGPVLVGKGGARFEHLRKPDIKIVPLLNGGMIPW